MASGQNAGRYEICPVCGDRSVTGYWTDKGPKFKCKNCRTSYLPSEALQTSTVSFVLKCKICKSEERTLKVEIKNGTPTIICTKCGARMTWDSAF